MEHWEKKRGSGFLYLIIKDGVRFAVYRKKGFTFIELLICLALVGLVLAICNRLFYIGQDAFSTGNDLFRLQTELRKAGDTLMDEIRYATEIDVLPSKPVSFASGYRYIYIEDSKLFRYYAGGAEAVTEPVIKDEDIFTIKKHPDNRNFLLINLTGTLNGNTYNLRTEVLLKNVSNLDPVTGKVLKYKMPFD